MYDNHGVTNQNGNVKSAMKLTRILAVIFALFALSTPGFAWDPPEPPGAEPTSPDPTQGPTPPGAAATATSAPATPAGIAGPTPPTPPETSEEEDPVPVPPPLFKTACEGVSVECVIDGDRLLVKFSEPQDEEMVQAGLNFCRSTKPAPASMCCYEADGDYKILVSKGVSDHSKYRAKRFCMCAWGLD